MEVDMEEDKVADMELYMVADLEENKVADMLGPAHEAQQ